jgi:pyochelin synthetase
MLLGNNRERRLSQSGREHTLDTKLGTYIRNAVWSEILGRATNVIVPLSEGIKDRPVFYCVHALSGGVTALGNLARLLGARQPFFGIQAPIDKRRAEFASSIESVANYYADALAKFQPSGKVALGGWSVGSIIALEMAQILRARGNHDILLINIDCELLNTGGGISRVNPRYYFEVVRNLPLWLSYQIRDKDWSIRSFGRRAMKKLSATTRVVGSSIVNGRMVRTHAVDGFMDTPSFSPDHKAFMAALFDALYRYVPDTYSGPVVIYEAMVQPVGHLRQVAATWRKIACPEVIRLMGTHSTIIKEPDGIALARHFRERLDRFAVTGSLEITFATGDQGSGAASRLLEDRDQGQDSTTNVTYPV